MLFRSLTSVGTLGSLTVANVASASTFIGNLTGTATTANNISSGSTGNIFYQSSSGITTFLANGTAGFILQSNGLGNAPSWVAAAPSSAISGLTIQDNTTQKGVANSITTLNFSGLNVSATASGGISTISISNNLVGTALSISGITTLSSTTIIGDGTSTGTAGQVLQVSGINSSVYIGGSVGIGSTNPASKLYVVGDTYITGILTANRIISSVYGEFTGGSISGTNIVGTALSISGISTVGFITATSIWNAGVTTSSSFVKINGTSSQFLKADGSVDSSTYLTTTGSGTNLTGIVTYITSGSGILVSQNTGNVTITGVGTQWLTTSVGIHTLSNVGIGTSNPTEKLTVSGKIQLQQDSDSNNRLVLRGQPSSSYRWNVDNYGSSNDFRIFREDDATAANGSVAVSISTTGTVTATKFSGDGSLLTGITASGSGVVVKDDGVLTGTATTIDFGTNLSVSF